MWDGFRKELSGALFAMAFIPSKEVVDTILLPFTHDWENDIPTAEDVKFSQEIWRKDDIR